MASRLSRKWHRDDKHKRKCAKLQERRQFPRSGMPKRPHRPEKQDRSWDRDSAE